MSVRWKRLMAQGRATPDLWEPGTVKHPAVPSLRSRYPGGLSLVQSAMVQCRPFVREPRQADARNPFGVWSAPAFGSPLN